MSTLQEKLKEVATRELESRELAAKDALAEVCSNSGISTMEMARLLAGSRTDTLRKRLVRRISSRLENALLERYKDTEAA
jgi:hypothetical protein